MLRLPLVAEHCVHSAQSHAGTDDRPSQFQTFKPMSSLCREAIFCPRPPEQDLAHRGHHGLSEHHGLRVPRHAGDSVSALLASSPSPLASHSDFN